MSQEYKSSVLSEFFIFLFFVALSLKRGDL